GQNACRHGGLLLRRGHRGIIALCHEGSVSSPAGMERVRAVFVYANPRGRLPQEVREGSAPGTLLLREDHLAEVGLAAAVHDPVLTRRIRGGLAHGAAWPLRELTLPLELPAADAVCTPLANFLPLTLRLRRLRAVVVNYGLNVIALRSSAARRRLL